MGRYLQVSKVKKTLDCSDEFVRQLIRDGKLKAINLKDRATRISEESLLAFIDSCRVDPEKYFE